MDADSTVDDETLRRATGLHIDTVRRLVTDKLLTPLETRRGRGQLRRWRRADFRRASLVAALIRAGFSARRATPIVNEFTVSTLELSAKALAEHFFVGIYDRVFAFFEAPPAYVKEISQDGIDYGYRDNRMLIAHYSGDPPEWYGFDNGVFSLERLVYAGLSQDAEERLRAERQRLRDLADSAHARAQNFESAIRINASRVIRNAELRAGLGAGKEPT